MWRMPPETAPHERTWMAFPREGYTSGARPPSGRRATQPGRRSRTRSRSSSRSRWSSTRASVDAGAPHARRRHRASSRRPLDEFWMRDIGPTFVVDDERPGVLGAVDWIFNGWGAPDVGRVEQLRGDRPRSSPRSSAPSCVSSCSSTRAAASTSTARAPCCSPRPCSSTRAATRTPTRRASRPSSPARSAPRTAIWLPRGLTRDYDDFGTRGHVDIVATIPSPGAAAAARAARPGAPRPRGHARAAASCCARHDGRRGPPLRDRRPARPGDPARRRGLRRLELRQPPRRQRRRHRLRLRRGAARRRGPRDPRRGLPRADGRHGRRPRRSSPAAAASTASPSSSRVRLGRAWCTTR